MSASKGKKRVSLCLRFDFLSWRDLCPLKSINLFISHQRCPTLARLRPIHDHITMLLRIISMCDVFCSCTFQSGKNGRKRDLVDSI